MLSRKMSKIDECQVSRGRSIFSNFYPNVWPKICPKLISRPLENFLPKHLYPGIWQKMKSSQNFWSTFFQFFFQIRKPNLKHTKFAWSNSPIFGLLVSLRVRQRSNGPTWTRFNPLIPPNNPTKSSRTPKG